VGFLRKRIKSHIGHALRLWSQARALRLSPVDTLRFAASDYGYRIGATSRTYAIRVDGSRVLLRSNAVDCKLLAEVFGGIYALPGQYSPKRIMDLGANIGLSALYFHRQYPEASIACVEPAPKNFSMLSRIVSLNALPATLFDCAIGPEAGSTALYDTVDPSCCTLLPDGERGENQITVQQKTVPEIMALLHWDRIDLLKIDIEGYERFLLRDNAVWLSRISCIVGEIHNGYDFRQLRKDLGRYDFEITERCPINEYGQGNFVAVSSVSAPVAAAK
jgi:FkbM family methyltransferase